MNKITAKCSQGNPGVKLCSTPSCQTVGVICGGECECSNPHKNCMRITNIESLLFHMEKKGEMVTPLFVSISEWCEKYIKQLQTLMFEMKNKIENPNESLRGKEKKLYFHLKNGKNEYIKGKLVSDVIQTLQSNQNIYKKIQNNTQSLNKILQKSNQSINIILNQIKQLGQYQKHVIGNSIHNLQLKNGFISLSTIYSNKQILANNTNQQSIALLNSPVQQYENTIQIYKFKIILVQNNWKMKLGLCYYSYALKQGFKGIYGQGCYCVSSNGSLYYQQGQQPARQANRIVSLKINDIIHLKFTHSNNPKLEIINVTKNQKDTLNIKLIKGDWLYPFVSLYGPNNKIQYLGLDLQ